MSTLLNKAGAAVVITASIAMCAWLAIDFRRAPAERPRAPYVVGDSVTGELSSPAIGQTSRTLVLFVRNTCRYCTDNMPFYQRLAARRAQNPDLRLVAASTQSVATTRDYLKTHGVVFDDVLQVSSERARIQGTPTLLLVDQEKKVLDLWIGFVEEDEEPFVMQTAFAGGPLTQSSAPGAGR